MRWAVFIPLAYLALGLEVGLRHTLRWGEAPMAVSPNFVVILGAFVAISAAPAHGAWASLLLGLLIDLLSPIPLSDGQGVAVLIGPHAVGYLVMFQFVQSLRGVVIRRNPIALVVLTVAAGAVEQVVASAFFAVRGVIDPDSGVRAMWMLINGLLSSVYTALPALLITPLLATVSPVFGFPQPGVRGGRYH